MFPYNTGILYVTGYFGIIYNNVQNSHFQMTKNSPNDL